MGPSRRRGLPKPVTETNVMTQRNQGKEASGMVTGQRIITIYMGKVVTQALSSSARKRRITQPAAPEPKPAIQPAAKKPNKLAAQPAAGPVPQPATKPAAQPAAKQAKKPRRKTPTPSLGSQEEQLD